MSINNLSNDRGGIGQFSNRPTFLRDEHAPTLMHAVRRYEGQEGADGASTDDNVKLFDGGAGKVDYRAIARAMMARLEALRERCFGGGGPATTSDPAQPTTPDSGDGLGDDGSTVEEIAPELRTSSPRPPRWKYHGQWYSTGNAPASPSTGGGSAPTAPAPTPPASNSSGSTSTPDAPNSTNSTGSSGTATNNTTSNSTTTGNTIDGASRGSISLSDGATTIANTTITGDTGIMGDNATHVTTLNVSNVTIRSTNYGIYLGDCENLNLSNVSITCDPTGGDSYSVRGNIRNLVSSDSTFNSGIKAFRIYGLEGGSSTRDTFTGDRLMLGGGYASEWGDPGPFHNFTFTDSRINVNSIEMYDDTSNVVFDGVDFAGTGHISIQAGAHDIVFRNCTNVPQIRLYDGNGNWTSPPATGRNIVVTN